ncbi:WD domain, G-beta repeat, putative [Leishmania donovani]|uniref:WD domain, G-beta repeat, putative n=1 Tax=Leishmania donovani TaxID=5661 RepID=A0A3Q8ID60_LEIDO|nr:WD domain, G-beta repeat, putative [Leishmania donovani]
MPESEDERRLRKEKRRSAARKADEAEKKGTATSAEASSPSRIPSQTTATASATTAAPSADAQVERKETEEERRIRKEKKRAQREAQKQQEAAAAAAADAAAATATASAPPIVDAIAPNAKQSKEERRAARKKDRCSGDQADDADAALLNAIEAENNAVVAQSIRNSRNFATAELKRVTEEKERKRLESAEERAERKRAEREERRLLRRAAAAGAAEGKGNAEDGGASAADAAGRVALSPVTAFDPSELQRQAYRAQFQKDLTRATALRRMVDFDSSGGVVLDLAPQSAYDLYIRDFGQSGREQVGVQAPPEEERLDAGTQAERGKLRARGAQAPDDLGLCPEEEAERQFFQLRRKALLRNGRGGGAAAGTGAAAAGEGDDGVDGEEDGEVAAKSAANGVGKKVTRSVDAAVLERFLTNTLSVMIAALDENNSLVSGAATGADVPSVESSKPKAPTAFSSSCTTFCWRGTRNRPVVQVLVNPSNPRQLIALHGAVDGTGPSPTLDTFLSVLLLWSVHDATTPDRVLVSCSSVTCMCVSPSRPHLVYGGTADGNACIWNLREPDRLHLSAGCYERAVFHLPSYNTGWQVGGHTAPVRQVRVAGYNTTSVATRKEEQYEQLVSMDDTGVMCYWALTEKRDPCEMNSGSPGAAAATGLGLLDSDYGLHPGSYVSLRLVKDSAAASAAASSVVQQHDEDGDAAVAYGAGVTGGFDFAPSDSTQCVLTAPQGVVRCSRIGGIASPSLYGPSCGNSHLPYAAASGDKPHHVKTVAVPCCVQYSILDTRWFVVGYEDGTVRLYLQHEATPQVTVEVGNQPIVAVCCSGAIPWVVWALDESGELHLIDFAYHRRQAPRLSHTLTQPDTGVCTCIDVLSKSEKADQHFLVAGFEKGVMQMHIVDVEKLRVAHSERDERWI